MRLHVLLAFGLAILLLSPWEILHPSNQIDHLSSDDELLLTIYGMVYCGEKCYIMDIHWRESQFKIMDLMMLTTVVVS